MNKTFKRFVAASLALLLVATGIGAYFTSSDVKSDAYTIGQVEVELVGDNNLYSVEDLTPRYEYELTRSIKNVGINDAYVFMTVTIPYKTANLHDADGHTILEGADVQLFKYGAAAVAGVSPEWKLVDAGKYADLELVEMTGTDIQEYSDVMGAVDEVGGTVTYVYGYIGNNTDGTLKALSADTETEILFDTMKLANVTDAGMEDTNGLIKTRAFAIQTLNVLETTYMQGNNADGSSDVNAVWAVLNNAAVGDGEVSSTEKTVQVTAKDKDGNDLNASASVITGNERTELLDALENQGLAEKEDVDLLIDVKSDDFEDMADTTFDVSDVANNGDKVIILHYNEEKGEWEYITEDIVENGEVGGDFSSFSPVAIVVAPKQETADAGLYDENNNLLISWEDLTNTEYKSYEYVDGSGYDGIFDARTMAALDVVAGTGPYEGQQVLTGPYHCYACENFAGADLVGDKLVLPSGIDRIGYGALANNGIKEIVISEGVERIDACAFADCTNLTTINIPASVNFIGTTAFVNCTNLKTVNFAGTQAQWEAITFELNDWNLNCPSDMTINFLG